MKISYTIKAFGVFSPKKVKKIHFLLLFTSYRGCRRVGFGAVKQYRQQTYIKQYRPLILSYYIIRRDFSFIKNQINLYQRIPNQYSLMYSYSLPTRAR